jgi:hypothetical protein
MQQEALVLTIPITRKGQMDYFQIRLPHNLERIVGVELGMLPDEGQVSLPVSQIDPHFQLRSNEGFGRLTLQVPNCGGIFFQGELYKDKNIHIGENIGFRHWEPGIWTHGSKRHEVEIQTGKADFVEGLYCNTHSEDDAYFVHVYLWIEKTRT